MDGLMSALEERRAKAAERQRRWRAQMSEEQRERARETSRQWRLANKEKARAASYSYYLRNRDAQRDRKTEQRYGLSPGEFDRMMEAQGGKCGICGCGASDSRNHRLHVDHCHKTGRVRGLLCFACNGALGKLKDDPELLRAALRWVDA